MKSLLPAVTLMLMIGAFPGSALAHSFMKKPFQKRYNLRVVSCNTCHVKGEEKDVINDFGATVQKLLEGMDVESRVQACKEADKETKEKIEKELAEEFVVVLKRLDTIASASGKPYADAIREGEVAGAKPRKPRAGSAAEEDDDEDEKEAEEDEAGNEN
jgi:ribosomal protein L23